MTSMLSLRDRASRDLTNRDLGSVADEDIPGEASEMVSGSGRDRRVTFGIRPDHRLELLRGVNTNTTNYPLRKCASVSFQNTTMEKRLRMMSHEN